MDRRRFSRYPNALRDDMEAFRELVNRPSSPHVESYDRLGGLAPHLGNIPRPRPDSADFPCRVGGSAATPAPAESFNIMSALRFHEIDTRIASLTSKLEELQLDLSRLQAVFVARSNVMEATRLQLLRLNQDAAPARHELTEHQRTLLDEMADAYDRFQQARTNVSLAQQAVDDIAAELREADVQESGVPSPPPSSPASDHSFGTAAHHTDRETTLREEDEAGGPHAAEDQAKTSGTAEEGGRSARADGPSRGEAHDQGAEERRRRRMQHTEFLVGW